MTWQKAQIVRDADICPGREIWVKVQRPYNVFATTSNNGGKEIERCLRIERDVLDSNILGPNGDPASLSLREVELLPEFADDVPMVKWEDFIKS